MNDVIKIEYPRGWMQIDMTKFFPCTKSKFKKLIRTINLDWRADKIYAQMREYFKFMISKYDSNITQLGKNYWDCVEIAAESRDQISNGTKPNGYPLVPKDIKDLEKRKKYYDTEAKRAVKAVEKYKKQKAWFEEVMELV